VAMKGLVEGLGLMWPSQFQKLSSNPRRWGIKTLPIPSPGGAQPALCMPVSNLSPWVDSLVSSRVSPEIRENIRRFREEDLPRLLAETAPCEIETSPGEISVPFYGQRLSLLDVDGEPFVAMKEIVEGMGLDWAGQHEKLVENKDRWGIRFNRIPPSKSSTSSHEDTVSKKTPWTTPSAISTTQPSPRPSGECTA